MELITKLMNLCLDRSLLKNLENDKKINMYVDAPILNCPNWKLELFMFTLMHPN